jgi:hypothetical protein
MKTLMPLNNPYCNIVLQLIYTGTLCTVNSQISEIFLFTAAYLPVFRLNILIMFNQFWTLSYTDHK